jgi:hypothetical protein
VALSLAVVFGAGPATALDDVTGVYSGTIACESTDGSGESRTPSEATSLYVDDAGSETAYAYLNNSGYTFRLAVDQGEARLGQGFPAWRVHRVQRRGERAFRDGLPALAPPHHDDPAGTDRLPVSAASGAACAPAGA